MAEASTMVTALQKVARMCPASPAIYYFDTVWSYDDLTEHVEQLAGALQRCGVSVGDRVAVMLQNMPASVVAHFAVWALGASVVPINVMLQPREMVEPLRDSGASALILLASLMDRVDKMPHLPDLRNVVVVSDRQDFTGDPPPWLPDPATVIPSLPYPTHDYSDLLIGPKLARTEWYHGHVNDLALLTYTSGTTGSPKGAMNLHGHVLHTVDIYRHLAHLPTDAVNIAFAPLFHITGVVAGLATAVGLANPLVLLYRFDPAIAALAIERRRATFTVGAITTYLAMLGLPNLAQYDLSSLTHAYSGGAPIARATLDHFEDQTGIYIHNVYGLTESTNGIILVPWGERAPLDRDSGATSVGIAGEGIDVSVRSLDDALEVLAPGELGELALRGDSVITAYWRRPRANRESFRDGWLLTGDVARMTHDGWIYIIDRKKDVIVSAGNKVWPRDVEDVLYNHPGVAEAVVVGLPDAYRGEVVTAFVVKATENEELTELELVTFLREHIAAYKVPRAIHWVTNIPKTATGKFMRRAFRPPADVDMP